MPIPQNFERAQLVVDGGEPIECAFNPQEYSITKTNVWTIKPVTGTDTPKPEFGGGMPWTIRVQLLLDSSLLGADKSIKDDAIKLLKMMESGGGGGGGSAPPMVTFKWGSIESPKMVGSSLSIRFVMFRPNGEPARALVDLELTQSEQAQPGQNPTTRAIAGLKVHTVTDGDSLRLPDVCTLAVGYRAKTEGNAFQALDDSKFEVGAKLEVKLGSADERQTTTIFKGEIVTVEPDFQAGGVSMVVRAYDKSHRMMRARKQRTFLNKTVSDIVSQICREYGLSASTTPSGGPLDSILQHNETDWDFIWRLARRVGFEFLVTDESQAKFGPPELGGEIELSYPEDLHTFRPRITAVQ